MIKIKNVVAYVRISSESQKDNTSIKEQKKRIEAYCTSQNWNLKTVFSDEAKSGATIDEREEYNKMIEFIKLDKNDINAVLVFKSDRIHRNLKNLLIMIEDELEPNNIAFISVSESFDTSTPQGMLTLQMLGSFAEFEKNLINERTRNGRIITAKNGRYAGGRVPYGYRVKDGKFIIEEDEAKIVKMIFKMYLEGESYRSISNHLNTHKKAFEDISSRSEAHMKKWSRTSICYILKNNTYTGVLSYNGEKEENNISINKSIPSIISKQLFNKAQKKIESKKKS